MHVGRDIGRCPVIHMDPSPPMEVGSYWQQADELRERGDAFFDTMAQGFWVFTRHEQVREIYKHPELFSSESFTPWEPDPAYRFIPTQIDPPDHIKYRQLLNPWFSPGAGRSHRAHRPRRVPALIEELAPRARATSSPTSLCATRPRSS